MDLWGEAQGNTNLFYVDIANVHGGAARRQHRLQCEERLEQAIRQGLTASASRASQGLGRAEVLNMAQSL